MSEKNINFVVTVSATPLSDAYQGGTFAFYTDMIHYHKQPLTIEGQLETLKNRGLIIEDFYFAREQLGKIG